MAGYIGNPACCCTPTNRWTPPPPPTGVCEYDPFCENNPATVTFGLDITILDSDNPCYINCDACPASPIELILSPIGLTPGAGISYWDACTIAPDLSDMDDWLGSCTDDCHWADFWGQVGVQRECEAADDDIICPVPPYTTPGTPVASLTYVTAFLRVFRDGCFKLVLTVYTDNAKGGGTIKVDPTDPNNTVIVNGCNTIDFTTFEGDAVCCGTAAAPSAGPYAISCTDVDADECVSSCSLTPSNILTMYC